MQNMDIYFVYLLYLHSYFSHFIQFFIPLVIGFTDLKGMGKTDFNFLDNPFQNFVIDSE